MQSPLELCISLDISSVSEPISPLTPTPKKDLNEDLSLISIISNPHSRFNEIVFEIMRRHCQEELDQITVNIITSPF